MSNIAPAAPPPEAPVTPAPPPAPVEPKHQTPADNLPAGLKVDTKHSADGFFEAHKAANDPNAAPAAPAAGVVAKPPEAPKPAAAEPAPEQPKGIAAKLAAKAKPPVAAPKDPEPAPASAANPEDAVTLDKSYSQAAHDSFKQIKTITTGLRDQLNSARETERQLRAQLDAAKSTTPAPDVEELNRLREENKRISDRLMVVDLREHPKFQAEFVMPQQAALTEASALLAANGVNGVDLQTLMGKPRNELGKAVSDLAAKLPEYDRVEFSENIRRAYKLNQDASAALGKSREIYGGLRNQTEAQQQAAFERTWAKASTGVSEHIVELDMPDGVNDEHVRAAVDQYNAAIKGLRTVAQQRAFGPATAENISENAIKSAAYDFQIQHAMPRLMGEFQALLDLNRGLTAQLQAIKSRNPNSQISGASTGGEPIGAGPDGTLSNAQLSRMTHAEAAAALAPRVGR